MDILDPLSDYLSRLELWRKEAARGQDLSVRLGNIRLMVVIAAAALAWLSWFRGMITPWSLLVPLALFIGLIVYHERVARKQQLAARAINYYERGLARLDDKWAGTGNPGDHLNSASHLYASDLDLFGRGSLFELVSVARTAEGEQRLADWLLAPARREEVLARQQAIADLRSRTQLREDVALLGDDIRSGVHAAALARWGAAPPVSLFSGARWLALAVSIYNFAMFVAWMSHLVDVRVFLAGVVAALLLGALLRKPVARISEAAETPARDLEILSLLLHRLETEEFDAPRLRELRAVLNIQGLAASRRIARLERWMQLLDSADHLFVRVVGPALLWRQQVAMSVESWRRENGHRVASWIGSVAELEALSSIAALAFERPSWTTPELCEGPPFFEGQSVRHPLMNQERCIPNDVCIGNGTRLLIVSGSNMSGKSTLLRAVGLNTVLAWAGAPVAAKRLRVSPIAVAASMRVVDSLQDGKSRFYAEITRLRQIVDLTSRDRPVLFLLDELLSGTNSHDRRIGAEGVVRTLVDRGAIGFVTTHDLALTQIVPTIEEAANVHFEDTLINGNISFDYRMRPGIVERSNALELMRAVGLEV